MKKNSTVRELHKKVKKTLFKYAKTYMNSNYGKLHLSRIKTHFKKGGGWPLDYMSYFELSNSKSLGIYNAVLLKAGYKIYFCDTRMRVMIKPINKNVKRSIVK